MIKRILLLTLIFLYFFEKSSSQINHINSAQTLLMLQKLKVCGSVLYIAAHPDDENNYLLPYLSFEKKYRVGYLSLTRGEGGQNLIGKETGIGLGLIRTQELLMARNLDGAEQYFTSAYDFGYTRSAEECLKKWNINQILYEMVWIIRQFQPDIIIKRFPPDTRAGHGQHATSSILADSAFLLAAQDNAFPEQFKYGLKPWKTSKLFWNTYNFGNNNTTNNNQLKLQINEYNPLLGISYGELGAEARSMHKSQGEGRPRRRGDIFEYFSPLAGLSSSTDLMDNIDISWTRFPEGNKIQTLIEKSIQNYDLQNPQNSLKDLLVIHHLISVLPHSTWKEVKLKEITNLIEICSGLFFEATIDKQYIANEDSCTFNLSLTKHFPVPIQVLKLQIGDWENTDTLEINSSQVQQIKVKHQINNSSISQPYFLEEELINDNYQITDKFKIGQAENNPSFYVEGWFKINSIEIYLKKPIRFKYVDDVRGELYQPLTILPIEETSFSQPYFILSKHNKEVSIKFENKKNINKELEFKNIFYNNPLKTTFTNIQYLSKLIKQETNFLEHKLLVDNKLNEFYIDTIKCYITYNKDLTTHLQETNTYAIKGEQTQSLSLVKINYDHIPNISYFKPTEFKIFGLPLVTNLNNKIGYIEGAGDDLGQVLQELGYSVDFLSEKDISLTNLKKYKALILGIRAGNIHSYISDKKSILNEFIHNGGNLIVQYIKGNNVLGKNIQLGPYSFTVNSSFRITDEYAKVKLNTPNHKIFNFPNKIKLEDFNNWVQERSTYEIENEHPSFEKLITMNDPGGKELSGSLVLANYGQGHFIYLGLSLFRQIPIGNPAAYKLLVNLVEY